MHLIKCLLGPCLVAVCGLLPVVAPAADGDEGYVLYAPLASTRTYLIDGKNHAVKTWSSDYKAGQSAYLLDDGSLLRAGMMKNADNFFAKIIAALPDMALGFNVGGVVERLSPKGELLWRYEHFSDTVMPHHDVEILPNGNVLMILWEYKTREEAIDAGRDPKTVDDKGLWVDAVLEIAPSGSTSGEVVWEWHAWDHMVQHFDPDKANYGKLADNPGRLDINNSHYVLLPADLMHTNSVHYNPDLDQVLLSSYNYSEFWIIDHATTSAEAAGEGGEFLYRWGNPAVYGHADTGAYQLGGTPRRELGRQQRSRHPLRQQRARREPAGRAADPAAVGRQLSHARGGFLRPGLARLPDQPRLQGDSGRHRRTAAAGRRLHLPMHGRSGGLHPARRNGRGAAAAGRCRRRNGGTRRIPPALLSGRPSRRGRCPGRLAARGTETAWSSAAFIVDARLDSQRARPRAAEKPRTRP